MDSVPNSGKEPSLASSAERVAERANSLQRIIGELSPFSPEDRRMLIETVLAFFQINLTAPESMPRIAALQQAQPSRGDSFQFSEEALSPKAFILNKSPRTDVERVACLAYYLALYRGSPHFKNKDITALNTESAQRPFSNSTDAINNAAKMGYLVPSVKGSRQLSAAGEQFVELLPDRAAAREALMQLRQRGAARQSKKVRPRVER